MQMRRKQTMRPRRRRQRQHHTNVTVRWHGKRCRRCGCSRRRGRGRGRSCSRKGVRKGGKAIGNGGFACVFYPALKCKSGNENGNENGAGTGVPRISKLMKSKYAKEEYNTILEIRRRLLNIPDMSRYFVLDNVQMCSPQELSEEDLKQYTQKCKPLIKMSITKKNINKPEVNSKLLAIQEPFGGVDVETFLTHNVFQHPFLVVYLVDSLLELFEKGVMAIHDNQIYHCDIKDSNILVQFENGKVVTRLIDWGISVVYNAQTIANASSASANVDGTGTDGANAIVTDNRPMSALIKTFARPSEPALAPAPAVEVKQSGGMGAGAGANGSEVWTGEKMETWNTLPATLVPHNLFDRPFHFNAPFSIIFFNNMFADQYNLFLTNRPEHLREQPLTAHESREFVSQFVPMWCQSRGDGHLEVINQLFGKVLGRTTQSASVSGFGSSSSSASLKPRNASPFLVEYLEKVVRTFGKPAGPSSEDKFNQYFLIYLQNADTWGFLTVFISIYEMFSQMNVIPLELLEELKTLVVTWLLEYATISIPQQEVVQNLREWNQSVRSYFQRQMEQVTRGQGQGQGERTRTSNIEVVVS